MKFLMHQIERLRRWLYGPPPEPRLPPELEAQFKEMDRQQRLLQDLVIKMRHRGLGWKE